MMNENKYRILDCKKLILTGKVAAILKTVDLLLKEPQFWLTVKKTTKINMLFVFLISGQRQQL